MRALLWVSPIALAFVVSCAGNHRYSVRAISFSPSGRLLAAAAVDEGAARADAQADRQSRFVVAGSCGDVVSSGTCVSRSVAWTESPLTMIYAVRDRAGVHAVAAHPQGKAKALRSPATEGTAVGAIGVRRQSIAFVAKRRNGRFRLCLWSLDGGDFSVAEIPEWFHASLDFAPVFSQSCKLVAVVNTEQTYFLGFETGSGRWVMPVTVQRLSTPGPAWEWRVRGKPDIAARLGWEGECRKFFVDDKSLALWVSVRGSPTGLTPIRRGFPKHPGAMRIGGGFLLWPSDELVPLDLDNRCERPAPGRFGYWPLVWTDYLEALSCDAQFHRIAVVYQQKAGRDCVLYVPQESLAERILVGDKSLSSRAISMTRDGRQLAVVRKSKAGQDMLILDTETTKPLQTWPLSRLISGLY